MIILARLLSPVDFGIIGLAMLSINALNVFSETGIESALIQRDKIGRAELNTAWTMAIMRGVLLFVILFLSAGWFASYFNNPTLEPVLKVMSITFLLGGVSNIGVVFFQKDLELKWKAILEMIADIAGTMTAVLLAFWLKNVWALVIGGISWGTVKCIGSYLVHSYRPSLNWDWHITLNLLNFGKHIFWISLMAFIITNLDDALVGKLLGFEMLGFYVMAFSISSIPVYSLSAVLSQVFFPAYAKIKNDSKRIEEAFGHTFEVVALILLPLTSLMFILAPSFTAVFMGEKWLPIIPALQVLCFFGLFRCVSGLFYPLHLALNRPDIQTKIKSLDLLTFGILIYPLTLKWGILGTSCVMAIVYLINLISNIAFTSKLILIRWKKIAISLLVPIMISLLFFLTYFLMRSVQIPLGEVTEFITALILCLCIGLITAVTFRKKLLLNFMDHVKAAQK